MRESISGLFGDSFSSTSTYNLGFILIESHLEAQNDFMGRLGCW